MVWANGTSTITASPPAKAANERQRRRAKGKLKQTTTTTTQQRKKKAGSAPPPNNHCPALHSLPPTTNTTNTTNTSTTTNTNTLPLLTLQVSSVSSHIPFIAWNSDFWNPCRPSRLRFFPHLFPIKRAIIWESTFICLGTFCIKSPC